MWLPRDHLDKKDGVNGIVAVAIDKDKGSQNALKWAIDHILTRGATVVLLHVNLKQPSLSSSPSLVGTPRAGTGTTRGIGEQSAMVCKDPDDQTKEIFRLYHVYCARKDINCKDVVLEDVDIAKALTEYVSQTAIEHLVIGSSNKTGFLRFEVAGIPGTVSKSAPDFCTVYVASKGKLQSMRSASHVAPVFSPLQSQLSQASSVSPVPLIWTDSTATMSQEAAATFEDVHEEEFMTEQVVESTEAHEEGRPEDFAAVETQEDARSAEHTMEVIELADQCYDAETVELHIEEEAEEATTQIVSEEEAVHIEQPAPEPSIAEVLTPPLHGLSQEVIDHLITRITSSVTSSVTESVNARIDKWFSLAFPHAPHPL